MFQKILLAVDGSEENKSAVSKAMAMARESGGSVTALFVKDVGYRLQPIFYSLEELDESARKAFAFVRSEAEAMGVEVDYKVAIGHAGKDIARLARGHDAVVCGTRGRSGMARAILGSVSDVVARESSCTTVVVSGRSGNAAPASVP